MDKMGRFKAFIVNKEIVRSCDRIWIIILIFTVAIIELHDELTIPMLVGIVQ